MKRLCMALIMCLTLLGIAKAESLSISEQLKKIPALKQGVAFSLLENDFSYLSTLEVAKWKGLTLEAGYSSKDKAVGVISYQILKLKDIIDLPILNLIEFNAGLYAGVGRIDFSKEGNREFDWGLSATIISVKF